MRKVAMQGDSSKKFAGRRYLLACLCMALAACHTAYVCRSELCRRSKDFESLAGKSLKYIELVRPVSTFVVPINFERRAREALAALRPVVTPDQVPRSDAYSLPDGYFVVEVFSVNASEARFEGVLGPALRSGAVGSADSCGTKFSIPFEPEGQDWASHSYKTSVCSSTNQIIPKG